MTCINLYLGFDNIRCLNYIDVIFNTEAEMEVKISPKNVQRAMTFNRYLYAVLQEEANKLNINVSDVVNQELSKNFLNRIELLKLQDSRKYS